MEFKIQFIHHPRYISSIDRLTWLVATLWDSVDHRILTASQKVLELHQQLVQIALRSPLRGNCGPSVGWSKLRSRA